MKVSYLTDVQVRKEYLLLLNRIDSYLEENGKGFWADDDQSLYYGFWNNLGYSYGEIPDW